MIINFIIVNIIIKTWNKMTITYKIMNKLVKRKTRTVKRINKILLLRINKNIKVKTY